MASSVVRTVSLDSSLSVISVYHGSDIEVRVPRLIEAGFPKDFGYGFYVTFYKHQAEKWAKRKAKGGTGVVSEYTLSSKYKSFRYLCFERETTEWVDFIAKCRAGYHPDVDVIEGPMADDTVWDFVNDYISGRISQEEFLVHCKYRHSTHQIAFLSDTAMQQCLIFKSSWVV